MDFSGSGLESGVGLQTISCPVLFSENLLTMVCFRAGPGERKDAPEEGQERSDHPGRRTTANKQPLILRHRVKFVVVSRSYHCRLMVQLGGVKLVKLWPHGYHSQLTTPPKALGKACCFIKFLSLSSMCSA